MFSRLFWCLCFIEVYGEMRKVSLPVYTPPTQEEILNTYFRDMNQNEPNRAKKSILSVPDNLQKTVETMKKELSANISNLEKELVEKNETVFDVGLNFSEPMQDYVQAEFFKNFLTAPIEPTTYRYPTAVWSSQNYEKLRNGQRFRPRNVSKSFRSRQVINPAYVYLDRGFSFASPEKPQRRNRGKTKWKDSNVSVESFSTPSDQVQGTEFADRFLEHSLAKYLTSSNLRENVGNVSVKTFSDILRNITEQKPRRPLSPYDENKELRMKFLEEVVLRKKNETKPHGKFLEKQLQKRLEKVQDVFNERDKDKILANMWKYTPLNRTVDFIEEKKNKSTALSEENTSNNITTTFEPVTEITTQLYNTSLIYFTTDNPQVEYRYSTQNIRGTIKFNRSKYATTESLREFGHRSSQRNNDANKDILKLTAEESSYYRKGQFPSLTFIGQSDKPGVIPGRPLIDYPVHSFPPPTKFKCPKFKGGKPIMMADPETRCQVFYICTGDGPTTAMLCPNGTMFNENFLVCDWWYNVKC